MSPEDPDSKRAVIGAESRVQLESLLSATDIADGSATDQVQTQLRLNGKWLCIGEQISQQRNGLVSHASYLWPLDPQLAVHLQIPAMFARLLSGFSWQAPIEPACRLGDPRRVMVIPIPSTAKSTTQRLPGA